MLKALIFATFLALAALPTASATVDPCEKYGVCLQECNGNGVCVVVWQPPGAVCGGVGFGLQGVGACANYPAGCVQVQYGFNREYVCTTATLS